MHGSQSFPWLQAQNLRHPEFLPFSPLAFDQLPTTADAISKTFLALSPPFHFRSHNPSPDPHSFHLVDRNHLLILSLPQSLPHSIPLKSPLAD